MSPSPSITTFSTRRSSSYGVVIVLYGILSLIWGYNWVVMKSALQYVGPFDFAALRGLVGVLSLFFALTVMRRPLRPQVLGSIVLLGLLQNTGFLTFVNWALESGGAGNTAVLVYTMPFWTLIISWSILGEKLRGLQWVAVGLALCGLILILEPWQAQSGFFSKVLAILGGVSWALSAVVAKKLHLRKDMDLLSLTAWQMVFGVIPLVLLALAIPSRPIEWSGYLAFALAFAGVLGTAVAWLLWLYVLAHLSAGTASLNTLAIPVIAVLFSWVELGERPQANEFAGMLVIAFALLLVFFLAMPRRHPQ